MFWLFVPLGYLLGSLSAAIITCRLMGLPDPRSDGSGNPGATNVLRLGGKKAAAATLIGDLLKGLLPVAAAQAVGAPEVVVAATALAAFLGHLYPVFFRFGGGKGVATAFGALIALMPLLAGAVLATWLLVAAVARLSSLAALVAAVLAPTYSWLLGATPGTTLLLSVLALFLVWRHRGNIRNIAAGTEPRIGRKDGD